MTLSLTFATVSTADILNIVPDEPTERVFAVPESVLRRSIVLIDSLDFELSVAHARLVEQDSLTVASDRYWTQRLAFERQYSKRMADALNEVTPAWWEDKALWFALGAGLALLAR